MEDGRIRSSALSSKRRSICGASVGRSVGGSGKSGEILLWRFIRWLLSVFVFFFNMYCTLSIINGDVKKSEMTTRH
jgi:hypothetical protein